MEENQKKVEGLEGVEKDIDRSPVFNRSESVAV